MSESFREGSPGHALVHSGWTFEIETDRTHRDRPVKRYKWTRGLHRNLPTSAAYEVWRDEQWPGWEETAARVSGKTVTEYEVTEEEDGLYQ